MEDTGGIMCNCEERLKECCKIRDQSLNIAFAEIEAHKNNLPRVIAILESISNVLEAYECFNHACLRDRIQWVCSNLQNLYSDYSVNCWENHYIKVEMLIAEIKALMSING